MRAFTPLLRRYTAWLAAALALLSGPSLAQDKFPSKPIKIVAASEAGSSPDILARVLGTEMGPLLGQSVVVENKPGAAGMLGASAVVNAPADGYTLLMATLSNVALAPTFYPGRYDPNKSFTAVGMVASVPLVLVASPSLQASNFAQLTDKLRKTPTISYSSPGVGGPQHLAGVLLQRHVGVPMVHVPYKSGGAAITAVAAGEVQFAFVGVPAATALVAAKKVVPIFVTTPKRSAALPDVPAIGEAGASDFDIDNWHVLLAPAGLAAPVRAAIEAALQKALTAPAVKDTFGKGGAEPAFRGGKDLEGFIAGETARWSKLVTDNKLKTD